MHKLKKILVLDWIHNIIIIIILLLLYYLYNNGNNIIIFQTSIQRKLHLCLNSYILKNDVLKGGASFCVIFLPLLHSCEDMHD